MKSFDKIIRFIIVFSLGACTYGFVCEAVKVSAERASGNAGGEILILPLVIILIALGYQIKANQK